MENDDVESYYGNYQYPAAASGTWNNTSDVWTDQQAREEAAPFESGWSQPYVNPNAAFAEASINSVVCNPSVGNDGRFIRTHSGPILSGHIPVAAESSLGVATVTVVTETTYSVTRVERTYVNNHIALIPSADCQTTHPGHFVGNPAQQSLQSQSDVPGFNYPHQNMAAAGFNPTSMADYNPPSTDYDTVSRHGIYSHYNAHQGYYAQTYSNAANCNPSWYNQHSF